MTDDINMKLEFFASLPAEAFFSKEGEDLLAEFFTLKQKVLETEALIKEKIEKKGCELNPDFSGIEGDKVRVSYHQYGAKYQISAENITAIPPQFYKTKYTPNSTVIDTYFRENHSLPEGISQAQRKKSIRVSLKKKPHIREAPLG